MACTCVNVSLISVFAWPFRADSCCVWYLLVCLVWRAVVWVNVAWFGVLWCGLMWRGLVWCGLVWCGVAVCMSF